MASIYDLKPKFQGFLRPFCRRLAGGGVTANQVTILAILISIAHGGAIAIWPGDRLVLILLPITLFVRMALNAIDGMLAREYGQNTRLGAILNELGDVTGDVALYLPFALIAGLSPAAGVLAAILAVMVEMTGALGHAVGAGRHYEGPMGKSDRAFAYGLLAFLLGIGLSPAPWVPLYQWLIVALLAITVVNRACKILAKVPIA